MPIPHRFRDESDSLFRPGDPGGYRNIGTRAPRWVSGRPQHDLIERRLLYELTSRGLLVEPFERAAIGRREVYRTKGDTANSSFVHSWLRRLSPDSERRIHLRTTLPETGMAVDTCEDSHRPP